MDLYLAILAGFGGMFGWGLADFFSKKTLGRLGSTRTLMWMQLFAVVTLLIYLSLNWEVARFTPLIILFLLLFGIAQASGYLSFYRGLEKKNALVSLLSPIFASQAAIAVLISAFWFGEAISGMQWAGLGITFTGIVLIAFQLSDFKGISSFKNLSQGIPEVLTGMLIFGIFFPCWDWFLGYQQQGWITSTIIILAITVLLMASLLLLNSKRQNTSPKFMPKEKILWIWLILIGFFDALATLAVAWGFRFTDFTSVVVMVSGAFSLPTVILARIFLKEKLVKNQVIGIAAIISGLIILAI